MPRRSNQSKWYKTAPFDLFKSLDIGTQTLAKFELVRGNRTHSTEPLYGKMQNGLDLFQNLLLCGEYEKARRVLQLGYDINRTDEFGENAAFLVYKAPRNFRGYQIKPVISFLNVHGANFNIPNFMGFTANDMLRGLTFFEVEEIDGNSRVKKNQSVPNLPIKGETAQNVLITTKFAKLVFRTQDEQTYLSFFSALNSQYQHFDYKNMMRIMAKFLDYNVLTATFDMFRRAIGDPFLTALREHPDHLCAEVVRHRENDKNDVVILLQRTYGVPLNPEGNVDRVVVQGAFSGRGAGVYRSQLANEQLGFIRRRNWVDFVLQKQETQTEQQLGTP